MAQKQLIAKVWGVGESKGLVCEDVFSPTNIRFTLAVVLSVQIRSLSEPKLLLYLLSLSLQLLYIHFSRSQIVKIMWDNTTTLVRCT